MRKPWLPAKQNRALPATRPNEMPAPNWNGTAEQAQFGEYNTLPSSVSQSDVEAIARQDARLKEGVKRLKEYAKHAKGVTDSLTDAHEVRADYVQHIFKCVQRFQKANAEVFKAGMDHREAMNEIWDALGVKQAQFEGKQEARDGFTDAKQRWGL